MMSMLETEQELEQAAMHVFRATAERLLEVAKVLCQQLGQG